MAQVFDGIDDDLSTWLRQQRVFFVATAPRGDDGHINVSPKGLDSFDVIDERTVAYLDLTGSGVETIAHVRENGRITLMFCAFEGAPRIVRLQGRGRVHLPGSPDFERLVGRFPTYAGARSIIVIELDRIADSCGYGVPLYAYNGERRALEAWADKKGPDGLVEYRATRNAVSIDALPGLSLG
jgi:pyridoxamine 5'-phosphate oxidase-like protein